MIRLALGIVLAGVALVIVPASATIRCKSSAPRGVTASYRIIDGRKCWYAGRGLAKSRLAWRQVVRVVRVKHRPAAPAAEKSSIEFTGAVDPSFRAFDPSFHAIDPSFEERWRTLAPVDWASTTVRH
jgi:hypothetical protein